MRTRLRRGLRAAALAALVGVLGLSGVHCWVARAARLEPPTVEVSASRISEPRPGVRSLPGAHLRRRGGVLEVGLSGTPEQIGYAHAQLARDQMVENEGVLLSEFRRKVRPAPLRWLLLDLAQLRYREVNRALSPERRREIAGEALGFAPDPYQDVFPTYQRFVYLNALYDISLSFERSPLIGCTSFTLSEPASAQGHTLLARAFDFDVHDVFDRQKAVFLVREDGAIPFASVAWPGLVGVVSGMNLEGLAVVVHGARAGEPRSVGEPVVHALRRVLSEARTVDDAVRALGAREPMVSHIVVATDATGKSVAIERVPGAPPHVRQLGERAVVTNHFEGPGAADPKNLAVRAGTSTLDRRARGDQLLAALPRPAGVEQAVGLLRDRHALGGAPLPLGDRRAIDAQIATHGVVLDVTARALWVSEAPHLLGRFVAFDLRRLLGPDYDPLGDDPPVVLPADPLLGSEAQQRLEQGHHR